MSNKKKVKKEEVVKEVSEPKVKSPQDRKIEAILKARGKHQEGK